MVAAGEGATQEITMRFRRQRRAQRHDLHDFTSVLAALRNLLLASDDSCLQLEYRDASRLTESTGDRFAETAVLDLDLGLTLTHAPCGTGYFRRRMTVSSELP
ncbi:hypothetical protein [Streptomyces natalensis]|uniref:hypothetical protein n=1 Tax=Streptomyces natalensis TaxID=68242 RepID=UPI000AA79AE8|nr:hypothetical protein [Streptomyces natalensis]